MKLTSEQLATQREMHDEVTRTIIIGILCGLPERPVSGDFGRKSVEIMALLKRRGYVAHIRACNQLPDGTNI